MPRVLPERPDIEHLKKQAKALLSELRNHNAGARLADAQHDLAREYGFASWPKLNAHVAALALRHENPFVGAWTANLAKSKRHPANLFRSATLKFEVSGDRITIVDAAVLESGDHHHATNTIQADGREHPAGRPGYVLTVSRPGPRVVEAQATHGGRYEGRVRYEVSPDGQTLTLTDGEGQMRVVFDRTPA